MGRIRKCFICKVNPATKETYRQTTRYLKPNKFGQQAIMVWNKKVSLCEECYKDRIEKGVG